MFDKKSIFPKIKKSISSFFINEKGNISKSSLLKAGIIATALSLSVPLNSEDASAHAQCHRDSSVFTKCVDDSRWVEPDLDYDPDSASLKATAHCSSHDNHGSSHTDCGCHGGTTTTPCNTPNHSNNLKLDNAGTAIVATHEHNISDINKFSITIKAPTMSGHDF